MNLYYGLTNFHLLCSILHKIIYMPDEDAIFVASEGRLKKKIGILKKSKIFKEVYYIEDKKIRDEKLNNLLEQYGEEKFNYRIEKIANDFKKCYMNMLPFNIKNIDKFFVFADHGAFGLFLLITKQKYIYLEDARGIYSNWKNLDRILAVKDSGMRQLCLYYKAYGKSDLITKRYFAFDSQSKDCNFENSIDFDINYLMDKLDLEQLDKILKIFKFKNYKLENKNKNKNALILTQRFSTFKLLTR